MTPEQVEHYVKALRTLAASGAEFARDVHVLADEFPELEEIARREPFEVRRHIRDAASATRDAHSDAHRAGQCLMDALGNLNRLLEIVTLLETVTDGDQPVANR